MATAGQTASGAEAMPGRAVRPGLWGRLPDRLPHLQGRRGHAVRIAYLVVAIAASIVIAGSFWFNARDYFGNMPTAAAYGFRTQTGDGGPSVAGVSGAEARASGLRAEDRFVSINGEPVPATATEYTIAERLSAAPDGRVTIVTRSTDGSVRTHRLRREPVTKATIEPVTRMPLWLFILLGFGSTQLPLLAYFTASLLLARRRPGDPEAMLFAFAFLLMSMNGASAFWLRAFAGFPEPLLNTVSNLGGCCLLAAIAGFPDGRFHSLLSRLALIAILLLAGMVVLDASTNLPLPTGLLFLLCNLGALGSVALRYRRTAPGLERQQIKWAVFSFCGALALLLPAQIASVLDLVGEEGPLPFLLDQVVISLAILLIAIGLLISLLRYRLYDAEAAISRSAGYAVLTLMLGAAFAASAKGLEWFFEANLGREGGALPGAIAAGLAVVMITPLHNRVHSWAERHFQKALLHLRTGLPLCVGDLRETATLEQLLGTVLARIGAGVRAVRGAVLLREGEELRVAATRDADAAATGTWLGSWTPTLGQEGLDCDGRDPLFPLRIALTVDGQEAPETIGWILLGARPDGSFYGKDEQEALAEIADPIARAVQIVRLREAREAAGREQIEALNTRLAALEAALAKTVRLPAAKRRQAEA